MNAELQEIQNPNRDVVKATYAAGLANYNKILQQIEDITFSKDTLDQDYTPLKIARELLAQAEAILEQRTAPHWAIYKMEREIGLGFVNPLKEVIGRKAGEFTKMANEVKADAERERKESERKSNIATAINDFIINQSSKIADSTTIDELNSIERMINLEATRKEKYQEFLELFKESCRPIRSLLADQKLAVKELAGLKKEANKEALNGNDGQAIELTERAEQAEAQISLNKSIIQHKAVDIVSKTAPTHEVILPAAPKARRRTWEVELVNPEIAIAKVPNLVTIELDTMKAKAYFANKRTLGEIPKEGEITLNGIRYYEKITY